MLSISLFNNFRDNEGKHHTELLCDYCEKSAEVYVILDSLERVCKTCLTKMINEIDRRIQIEMKHGRRK